MSDIDLLNLQMTHSLIGITALIIFIAAYFLVMSEEMLQLKKSKPVVFAAGIIWALVAIAAKSKGFSDAAQIAVKHNILEYAELFLFLLVAMTYVNAMEERKVFEALKGWLVKKQFSYRSLFWITGILAFFISPFADNMTTAMLMCAIIMAVGANNERFVTIACINIVVAANAGGAFSPFGDITTLMVWQEELVPFSGFFHLFLPAVVNFMVPAALMHFAIPHATPPRVMENIKIAPGGITIVLLFLVTIIIAVCFHNYLSLPPMVGMMTGLSFLLVFGYFLNKKSAATDSFDIFRKLHRIEWDTLLFFYGVLLCVGGLAAFGYLQVASEVLYGQWGASFANITIGILSAILDNIPLMFSVLTMDPHMSQGQWLLITLTAGVGGSLLSIGSAAGVALMGQSKGRYTFFGHLKWTWAITLGYFASIACHFWINHTLFTEFLPGV